MQRYAFYQHVEIQPLLVKPIIYLDITHQFEVLNYLFELNCSEQRTIVDIVSRNGSKRIWDGSSKISGSFFKTPLCIPKGIGRYIK